MKPNQILEKLATLDPENKDHWTQDGQPRLGAIGEGVKREDLLGAAPLCSQTNPVLPGNEEPELSDEELADAILAEQEEFEDKMETAKAQIKAAEEAKREADKALEASKQAYEKLRDEEKAKDTRTDTEINMDYLRSEVAQRQQRYENRKHIIALLQQTDFNMKDLNFITMSDADRAIAERVVRSRRERNKRSGIRK